MDAERAAGELVTLIGDEPALVVTSDLARARQTAEVIAARLGVRVVLDQGLREQHLGTLQGRLTSELTPEPVPDVGHISEERWGGGESIQDVHGRLERFFDGWRAAAPRHFVTVTHGDALRVARAVLAGRSHREVEWDLVPNGAVVTITWRPV